MAAGSAGSPSANAQVLSTLLNLLPKRKGNVYLICVLAYLVGTQHGRLLGTLLKVLVALGSEIPGT